MRSYDEGLRCQDVGLGLREIHQASSRLGLVRNTLLVGMAADLAGLIRGRNVIDRIDSLEIVASETLDIPIISLSAVLDVLETVGMVEMEKRQGRIERIIENVPVFRNLYEDLGKAWRERQPRQIEEELLVVVDRLARGPVPLESVSSDLRVDPSDIDDLYRLGVDSSIFKTVDTVDGTILYSPYTAFENPAAIRQAIIDHGSDAVVDAFQRVTAYQGLPVSPDLEPILADAIRRGLLPGPTVILPNGTFRSFAALPYMLDKTLTRERKMILDKALSIVACIRCGQHFGGATATRDAVAVLRALRDREALGAHSSHARQYKLLRDLGVIRFLPSDRQGSGWVRPSLIKTAENVEAVNLAINLISGQEVMLGRESNEDVKLLLDLDARALKPLQASARSVARPVIGEDELARAFDDLLGRGEL